MDRFKDFIPNTKIYMIFIAVLISSLFIVGHMVLGFLFFFIFTLLIIYNVKTIRKKHSELKEFIEEFSNNLDSATRNTLVNLPFPMMIVTDDGDITWYNNKLTSIIKREELLGKNINSIVNEFDSKDIKEGIVSCYRYIKIDEKYFDIYTNVVKTNDETYNEKCIIILYFYDVTKIKQYKGEVESIMLIEVDNLDEVIKSTEEDYRPLLAAEIERNINSYAQGINAMIRKYSSNKYVLSIQEKYIQEEIKKKFEILDIIREINLGNKLAVTLSIGVGKSGDNPLINSNFANSAKELALGRGGDQAVVKSGEKMDFFGGKTKEVEKRTKVRARVVAHALNDLIKESSKVYIMGHKNPDMDCFGASVGLSSAVKKLNKECHIVLKESGNGIRYIVDKIKEDSKYDGLLITPEQCKEMLDDNSLLILADVHSMGYVQDSDIVKSVKNIVIIDHHRRTVDFIEGAILTYIEIYASSTSELVTEMIQYMLEKPKLSQLEAEALLAGICVDTKNFYLKTGVRTFEAASFLRRLGADTVDVKKMFGNDLSTYIERSEIIKNAKVENNIAIAIAPPNIEDTVVAAKAADELLNITGIQASFVLVTIDKDINISGRSLGDINVQLVLETLGGGGHMTIAGAKVSNSTPEEVVKKLKDAINKYSREGEVK